MKIYVCTDRKYNGKSIVSYVLGDVASRKTIEVTPGKLKEAMQSKRVDVLNLVLTSDNRLMEAGRDKIKQITSIMRAPEEIRGKLTALDSKEIDAIEDLMDQIMHNSIHRYTQKHGISKYAKMGNFNDKENTCVLRFTLGVDSYVLLQYDKVCYGKLVDDNSGCSKIYFDVAVTVVAISNKKETVKISSDKYMPLHAAIGSHLGKAVGIFLQDGKFNENTVNMLEEYFGHHIFKLVANVFLDACESNDKLKNNSNIAEYIEYDEELKEYIIDNAEIKAEYIGTILKWTAIGAAFCALNPATIAVGLLGKAAATVSIAALNGAIGVVGAVGATAGGTTAILFNKSDYKDEMEDLPTIGEMILKNPRIRQMIIK